MKTIYSCFILGDWRFETSELGKQKHFKCNKLKNSLLCNLAEAEQTRNIKRLLFKWLASLTTDINSFNKKEHSLTFRVKNGHLKAAREVGTKHNLVQGNLLYQIFGTHFTPYLFPAPGRVPCKSDNNCQRFAYCKDATCHCKYELIGDGKTCNRGKNVNVDPAFFGLDYMEGGLPGRPTYRLRWGKG